MTKLLLVEDEGAVRQVLCEALELEGHEVDCVACCSEADAALAQQRYALLITDVHLPDGSGKRLAARAVAAGLKVILVSGHPDDVRGIEPGPITGVLKPFRLDDLTRAVTAQLGA